MGKKVKKSPAKVKPRAAKNERRSPLFQEIGYLHRPRMGGIHFYQTVKAIPIEVHDTLTVYMRLEEKP